MFDLSSLTLEEIKKNIDEHDVIVFMTQWVYDISKKIAEYMFSLKTKKVVIEVYIYEPTWYYKPKTIHDVYIYSHQKSKFSEDKIKFYKLSNKPYWDYKNEFNK